MSWDELRLASELREAVDNLGWNCPTQVQSASIPPMLKGQDVALQSRTGSGKTGAFVLPLLQRAVVWQHGMKTVTSTNAVAAKKKNVSADAAPKSVASSALPPVFLVLVPSVELCAQTVNVFESLGKFVRPRVQLVNLPARQQQHQSNAAASGGMMNVAAAAPVEAPINSALALVSTPAFLVKAVKSGILSIDLVSQISVLVVDEADMLTSHASMQFLYGLLPPTRQSIVLSATLTESVARLKGALLNQPIAVRVDEEENLLKGDALLAKMKKKDGEDSATDNKKEEQDENEVRVVLPPEDRSKLKQYYLVATDDCNRHTLLYSLFRFQGLLLPGKTLIFVDDEKEPYRVQHFLEQLAIHALVYDMTLPIKARCDILDRFQAAEKGVLICTDHTLHMAERLQAELGKQSEKEQGEVVEEEEEKQTKKDAEKEESDSDSSSDDEEDEEAVEEDAAAASKNKKNKKQVEVAAAPAKTANNNNNKKNTNNVEPGLSRGIDFQNVTNVVLFQGVKTISDEAFTNYLHRVGRTARAGQEGMAISLFSVPEAKQMLGPLRDFLRESRGEQLRPFKKLERSHAAALQYRVQAAVQNVTRHAAKKLRVANVAAEMGRSAYLSTRLNEADTGVLKRLMSGATKKISGDKNLRNVPEYMHIEEADDTSEFEDRVAARKLTGGSSRAQVFKNLASGGRRGHQENQKNKNSNNNNNKGKNNNNNSKRPVSGKKQRSESSSSSSKNNKNQRSSSSNNNRRNTNNKKGGGVDPLARVAAKMASKRRRIEASD